MGFAEFVQVEEKVISDAVKSNLLNMHEQTEKKLKYVSEAMEKVTSATTNGIVSGMSEAGEKIDNVITGVDFGTKIANIVSPPKQLGRMRPPEDGEGSDYQTKDSEQQTLHTTHLTQIARNTSMMPALVHIHNSLIHIYNSLVTISNRLISRSKFAEEEARERRVREDKALDVQQDIAGALRDQADKKFEFSKKGIVTLLAAAAGVVAVGWVKGWKVPDALKAWAWVSDPKVRKIGKGVFNLGDRFNDIVRIAKSLNTSIITPIRTWISSRAVTAFPRTVGKIQNVWKNFTLWWGSLTRIKGLFSSGVTKIGDIGLDIITSPFWGKVGKFFGGLRKIGAAIVKWTPFLADAIKLGKSVGKFAGLVGLVIMIVDGIYQGIKGAMQGWKEGGLFGAIKGATIGIFNAVVGDVVNILADILGWGIQMLGRFLGIKSLEKVGKTLMKFDITKLFKGYIDFLDKYIWTPLFHPLKTLQNLITVGSDVIKTFVDTFLGIFKSITGYFKPAIDFFRRNAKKSMLDTLGLKNLWESIKAYVNSVIPQWLRPSETKPDMTKDQPTDKPGILKRPKDSQTLDLGEIQTELQSYSGSNIKPILSMSNIDRGANLKTATDQNVADEKLAVAHMLVSSSMNQIINQNVANGTSQIMLPEPSTDPIAGKLRESYST